MNTLIGHTFPYSKDFRLHGRDVESFLRTISPTIKITALNTTAINLDTFNNIVNALSGTEKSSLTFNDAGVNSYLEKTYEGMLTGFQTRRKDLPKSINLFFNTILYYAEDVIDLVITSSPQIKIDLTKGWKTNQSIFNFLKESLGNNPFTSLFGNEGEKISNIFKTGVGYVQSGMQMTGRDIQIGPYWSFSNSPLSNYPEFSMETVLINDCEKHWLDNKKIVEHLTIDYLPTTANQSKSQFQFVPPYLFNIEIGVDFGFKKKIYLCKATFNVVETGKYFLNIADEKIPEFFKVTCHFTSLLPDIANLTGFFKDYNTNYVPAKKQEEPKQEQKPPEEEKKPIDAMIDSYEEQYNAGKLPAIALPPDAVRAKVGQPVQHYDPNTGFNPANPRDTSHMKVGPWRSW